MASCEGLLEHASPNQGRGQLLHDEGVDGSPDLLVPWSRPSQPISCLRFVPQQPQNCLRSSTRSWSVGSIVLWNYLKLVPKANSTWKLCWWESDPSNIFPVNHCLFTVIQMLERQTRLPWYNLEHNKNNNNNEEEATTLIKSHLLTRALSLGASEVPFPLAEFSSTWNEPHYGESTNNRVTQWKRSPEDGVAACQDVLVGSSFLPADGAIQHAHNQQGGGQVPRVTHGDEHHVVMILEVPLRTTRRIQHKTDLEQEHREPSQSALRPAAQPLWALPARTSFPAAWWGCSAASPWRCCLCGRPPGRQRLRFQRRHREAAGARERPALSFRGGGRGTGSLGTKEEWVGKAFASMLTRGWDVQIHTTQS